MHLQPVRGMSGEAFTMRVDHRGAAALRVLSPKAPHTFCARDGFGCDLSTRQTTSSAPIIYKAAILASETIR